METVQVDKILAKLIGPVQIENAQSAVVQPVPPVEELVALKKQVYIYSNSFEHSSMKAFNTLSSTRAL